MRPEHLRSLDTCCRCCADLREQPCYEPAAVPILCCSLDLTRACARCQAQGVPSAEEVRSCTSTCAAAAFSLCSVLISQVPVRQADLYAEPVLSRPMGARASRLVGHDVPADQLALMPTVSQSNIPCEKHECPPQYDALALTHGVSASCVASRASKAKRVVELDGPSGLEQSWRAGSTPYSSKTLTAAEIRTKTWTTKCAPGGAIKSVKCGARDA